jgi:hypothetical protein
MEDTRDVFTTPQVARIIEHSLPKTIAYIDRGIVKPSIQAASGHGSKRLWSYLDVVRMAVVRHLEELGLTVPMMRLIGAEMHDEWMEGPVWWLISADMPTGEEVFAALSGWIVLNRQIPGKEKGLRILRSTDSAMASGTNRQWPHILFSMHYFHGWVAERLHR